MKFCGRCDIALELHDGEINSDGRACVGAALKAQVLDAIPLGRRCSCTPVVSEAATFHDPRCGAA